jgi:hypothetical protein
MTDPCAFISFDFDHNENNKRLFAGQARNSRTPFTIVDWSSKEGFEQNGWEEMIRDRINQCNMVIVLVGRYMANAAGVVKEVKMAKEQNVPLFGVYVDGANSFNRPPDGLMSSRVIPREWDKIASMIDQMMAEGKNSQESFFGRK